MTKFTPPLSGGTKPKIQFLSGGDVAKNDLMGILCTSGVQARKGTRLWQQCVSLIFPNDDEQLAHNNATSPQLAMCESPNGDGWQKTGLALHLAHFLVASGCQKFNPHCGLTQDQQWVTGDWLRTLFHNFDVGETETTVGTANTAPRTDSFGGILEVTAGVTQCHCGDHKLRGAFKLASEKRRKLLVSLTQEQATADLPKLTLASSVTPAKCTRS